MLALWAWVTKYFPDLVYSCFVAFHNMPPHFANILTKWLKPIVLKRHDENIGGFFFVGY